MRVNVVPKQDIFTHSHNDRSLQAYGLMGCFASKQDAQKACDTLLTDEEWNRRKLHVSVVEDFHGNLRFNTKGDYQDGYLFHLYDLQ